MTTKLGIGSMTYAVMAQNALGRSGVSSRIIRLDPSETVNGCAYGLETDTKTIKKATSTLKRERINYSILK